METVDAVIDQLRASGQASAMIKCSQHNDQPNRLLPRPHDGLCFDDFVKPMLPTEETGQGDRPGIQAGAGLSASGGRANDIVHPTVNERLSTDSSFRNPNRLVRVILMTRMRMLCSFMSTCVLVVLYRKLWLVILVSGNRDRC
jgi:hypothetical protein